MITAIFIDATTEELERALPFTKGKWKPYSTPIFDSSTITPVDFTKIDTDLWKFELPKPYNLKK